MDGYKTNHNNTTFESHEDGPLKYVEIGRKREIEQRIGKNALHDKDSQTRSTQSEYSAESEKQKIRNKAKKSLRSVVSPVIDTVIEKLHKIWNKAKIPLGVIALSALIAVGYHGISKPNPKGNNVPRNQQEWEEEETENAWSVGGQFNTVYDKKGSKVEITLNNTHYTFEDPDNDTYIERAEAINSEATGRFESTQGQTLSSVKRELDKNMHKRYD